MSRSRREGRGEGGFHHRHHGGGYSRGGRRRGIGSNHRGLSKRRRFDKMEEDHVIDTYDAEDGNVHVVNDVAADNDRIATHEVAPEFSTHFRKRYILKYSPFFSCEFFSLDI